MRVESLSEYYEAIVFIELNCPNFPNQEYRSENKFVDIDDAFQFLREGLVRFGKKTKWKDRIEEMNGILDEAYLYYKDGDNNNGYLSLVKFEKILRNREK